MTQYSMPLCCSRCLADDTPESWRLQAETREQDPDDRSVTLVTSYWIDVPLCQDCYRHLTRQCLLYWGVGAVVGLVTAGLVAQFGVPQLPAHMRDVPPALGYVLLAAVGLLVAWGTAWALGDVQTRRLAAYNPVAGQIKFGSKEYQALFDEANLYMPKPGRSSLGV